MNRTILYGVSVNVLVEAKITAPEKQNTQQKKEDDYFFPITFGSDTGT